MVAASPRHVLSPPRSLSYLTYSPLGPRPPGFRDCPYSWAQFAKDDHTSHSNILEHLMLIPCPETPCVTNHTMSFRKSPLLSIISDSVVGQNYYEAILPVR